MPAGHEKNMASNQTWDQPSGVTAQYGPSDAVAATKTAGQSASAAPPLKAVAVSIRCPAEVALGVSDVHLTGTFCEWSTPGMKMHAQADGSFSATVDIVPGQRALYKFILNGERWAHDPCADTETDGAGHVNNVIEASAPPASQASSTTARSASSEVHSPVASEEAVPVCAEQDEAQEAKATWLKPLLGSVCVVLLVASAVYIAQKGGSHVNEL